MAIQIDIDMPKSCETCVCYNIGLSLKTSTPTFVGYCNVKQKYQYKPNIKPDWCPLKECK